jgi:hypothetical protein
MRRAKSLYGQIEATRTSACTISNVFDLMNERLMGCDLGSCDRLMNYRDPRVPAILLPNSNKLYEYGSVKSIGKHTWKETLGKLKADLKAAGKG